ncbi:pyridine nucleotide-disulfide oxidoreductase family protein [Mycobacterium ulcerans str. Harvey]|uniref:Pyridine nucleotide-disulfide oxidoreductase family protein n=1 Tax=Mycobacterium ulcerans str. Harvey TaxID=1299332 RepID=A0ABN0R9Q1_MYCUL|nr:pyridine nucleotide-disulfide oxidoreductase family protein [Mycobacterium ulcerans str. Harvey]
MHTLGFRFRPWTERQAIADGKPILEYVKGTAAMYGIDKHIRLNQKVISADWSNAQNRWTLQIESNGAMSAVTCSFLLLCSGYYNYDQGYTPNFAGAQDFAGSIIHPQHWPEDLDYDGKNVVVIGSVPPRSLWSRRWRTRGKARHDAAALADLHSLPARTGQHR